MKKWDPQHQNHPMHGFEERINQLKHDNDLLNTYAERFNLTKETDQQKKLDKVIKAFTLDYKSRFKSTTGLDLEDTKNPQKFKIAIQQKKFFSPN